MSNVNMADAAAARREARRKRILENSHTRLQRISGKCGDEIPRESPVRNAIPVSIHEISHSLENSGSNTSVNNGVVIPEPESLPFEFPVRHDIAAGDGEVPSELAPFLSPAPEPTSLPPSLWEKLADNKYDIVLLSLLIQLLYGLSLVSLQTTNLFLPVLIYVLTKLIWFPSQNKSSLSNVLQLLHLVSSHRVQKVIYLTQCLAVITCDVSIFLFTTICIQSLLITLKDGFIT